MLKYIGPDNGQGIQIHLNGVLAVSDNTKSTGTYQSGDGRVVLGRQFIDDDSHYVSVDVDELLFFNETLSDQDIQYISK